MSTFEHSVRAHIQALAKQTGVLLSAQTENQIRIFANLNVNWITAQRLAPTRPEIEKQLASNHFHEQFLKSAAYPSAKDQDLLLQRLTEIYSVDPEYITVTAGADEAIADIAELFCEDIKDQILIVSPTYWTYTKTAKRFKGSVINVPLIESEDDFNLNTQHIIDALNSNPNLKVVYIPNPNNPTGSYFNEEDITEILKAAEEKGVSAVVDEAYIEIAQKPSFTRKLDNHPNLIVLKTLSKAYGIAGERIGCIICKDPNIHKALKQIAPMFENTSSSIQNALRVLEHGNRAIAKASWDTIARHREALRQSINQTSSMRAFKSHANLILMRVDDAQETFDAFLENGIMPANPALFGFSKHLRISLGREEDLGFMQDVISRMDLNT